MSADVATVLGLAGRGWQVFPVRAQSKLPLGRWSELATTDPEQIAAWFAGATLNVGVACGPSGLLVVDEDTPGDFAKYAAEVGEAVPETFTVETARGQHLYFDAAGHNLGNGEGGLGAWGVNVRGRGGYVVGPGSQHPSGAVYAVTDDRAPAPIPLWLVQALRPAAEVATRSGEVIYTVEPVGPHGLDAVPAVIAGPRADRPGQRHRVLVSYAGWLRRRNLPEPEAELLYREVWGRCEQPPLCESALSWREAQEKLRDTYARYSPGDAGGLPGGASLLDPSGEDLADGLLGRVLGRSELAELPAPMPLIEGLIDYPSAGVLVGGYGVGKTFLAIALACCVATGRAWLGQPVQRRRVLLVVGEGGSGLDTRIAAWEQGYNGGEAVSDTDLLVMVQPQSLSKPEVWHRIAERCAEGAIGFVVLDTFSSLAPDADETKDAALAISQMSRLARGIEGAVLLVHHPGWSDSTRTRGGYQFEANTDLVLLMKGTPQEPLVQLLRKKVKDGESGQVHWLRRTPFALSGERIGQRSMLMASVNPDEAGVPYRERIAVVLEGCGDHGATGPQLLAEVGEAMPRSTFYKALGSLVADGVADKRGSGNATRYVATGAR